MKGQSQGQSDFEDLNLVKEWSSAKHVTHTFAGYISILISHKGICGRVGEPIDDLK